MISKALKFILLCAAALLFLVSIGVGFIYLQNLFAYNTIATYEIWASWGLADAKYRLALSYIKGGVLDKNIPKAIELLTEAGDQNHSGAINELGILYAKGEDVPQDYKKAFLYYEKAAALNNEWALLNLGAMYQSGYGKEKDYKKSLSFYQQSETLGNAKASFMIGKIIFDGLGVKSDISNAFPHFLRSAEKGYSEAQYWVGWYYQYGIGNVGIDYGKAYEWYEKASSQNHSDASYAVGILFSEDKGVNQDYLKAGEYFYKAASLNNADAIKVLNEAKETCAKETAKNTVKRGLPSCFIAASTRDPISMYAVGFAYNVGLMNLKRSYEDAFAWLLPCAEYGYAPCQVSVGSFYKSGKGAEKNLIEAYAWFSAAFNSNDLRDRERRLSEVMIKIIDKDMTEEQKIKAEKRAKEYTQLYSKIRP